MDALTPVDERHLPAEDTSRLEERCEGCGAKPAAPLSEGLCDDCWLDERGLFPW